MWSSLNKWFWSEKVWLWPNATWADLEDRDDKVFIALPLSHWLGVKDQLRRPAKHIPELERHFVTAGPKPKEAQLALLATQCGLTLHQTWRWFCRRRNQDRPQRSKKFCEASWKFTYYLCVSLGGFFILYHESWLSRPVMCWDSYPNQPLKPALYCWYLLELSFYVSLLITLPFDTKRKDFKENVWHHLITIALIVFSYSCNLLCIGSLVLLLHNPADFLLEACKMYIYMQYRKVANILFIIFAIVFFCTRLVLFPTQILYTTYFEIIVGRSPFFAYYFFNGLLMMLQVLHVFWFYLILHMVCKFTWKEKLKDVRSDVEESTSSDSEEVKKIPPLQNVVAQRLRVTTSVQPQSLAATLQANRKM